MKKQFFLTACLIFLTGLMLVMPRMAAAQDPVAVLNSVANDMIASLKAKEMTLKTNPAQVYSLAYKLIVPHADLDYMSQRVLPPQTWGNASPAQRADFKKEFTTLLVRTYASALADYSDQTVRFYPVRGGYAGKSTVQVKSEIVRSDGPTIGVTYSLVAQGSEWKLFDIIVEGVSMLESFRSQFADKLSSGDITQLVASLQQHNAANSGE